MESLDWNGIRPLNGSQAAGFEELCAQLARVESPTDAKFHRKGSPDAGVECFCILPGGREWGWQAKCFTTLGASQVAQLDESVRRALDKHPQLVRYFVCIPIDRPDARLPGQTICIGTLGKPCPEMARLGTRPRDGGPVHLVGFFRAY